MSQSERYGETQRSERPSAPECLHLQKKGPTDNAAR